MSYRRKFRVPKLKLRRTFADSQKPVIEHYLSRVLRCTEQYRKIASPENLHNLRIALRRLRYVLELYSAAMKPARFAEIYETAVGLQNTLGERRDIDVLYARLLSIYRAANAELPSLIATDLEQGKAQLDAQIEKALTEFVQLKQIRKLVGD